jgi:hypothetical protein
MTVHTYFLSGDGTTYTVAFYTPSGQLMTVKTGLAETDAQELANYLNGGTGSTPP